MTPDASKTSPLRTLMRLAAPFRGKLAASMALSTAGVAAGLAPYVIVAWMIRMVLEDDRRPGALVLLALAAAAAQLLKVALAAASAGLSHRAAFGILEALREAMAAKMCRLDPGEAAARNSGQYKALMVDVSERIELPLAHLIPEVSADLMAPLAALCYLAWLDWRLALASLATLPAGALSYWMMTRDYRARFGKVSTAVRRTDSAAVEYVTGLEAIRAFSRGKGCYARFREAVEAARDAQLEWCRATGFWYSLGVNVAPATLTALLPLGIWLHASGSLDPAALVAAALLSLGLAGPLLSALEYTDSLAMVGDALNEAGALLGARESGRPASSAPPTGDGASLERARYGYAFGTPALEGLDLALAKGTVTALVGPSGGGKSTAARLLAGHLDPDSGRAVIGGADAMTLSLEAQARHVAYMAQESWLFDWTLIDNIRLGRPAASDAEVREAAGLAGCRGFIESLPDGYLTMAGEGGSRLSGGERQRVALARAALAGSPVLVLDEATAYADPESELAILQGVAKLAEERTVLAIAHRLSTSAGADLIVVLDRGRAVAAGTHKELLESSPLYASMWAAHVWEPDPASDTEAGHEAEADDGAKASAGKWAESGSGGAAVAGSDGVADAGHERAADGGSGGKPMPASQDAGRNAAAPGAEAADGAEGGVPC
ncbi:MAG: ABC transporter ATP-binding protein/permease [Deltaproteobacteria bacterium]|jgi:ATP-binding cassette subfamily B protein|nr:ABC transporter ATP-binding protein/permease [Deltaproteobacteria bacterium]